MATKSGVVQVNNLQDWFRHSVTEALQVQQTEVNDHTHHYVVSLLANFSRAENFYEHSRDGYGLKPLAIMMSDALESPNAHERNLILQRLGDVALFIGGFFAESLSRKLVDVDYYNKMGETAYNTLSVQTPQSIRDQALQDVFRELAEKFTELTDVLAEVAQQACVSNQKDILRIYEIWMRTGSKRAERQLRELGIMPAQNNLSRTEH
ncbi:MAG: hypothetical protein MJA83_12195 [Gammaproteobacteria bacterium]|nr:hypothetical protein [Gammaproteobacteria bacterium]